MKMHKLKLSLQSILYKNLNLTGIVLTLEYISDSVRDKLFRKEMKSNKFRFQWFYCKAKHLFLKKRDFMKITIYPI